MITTELWVDMTNLRNTKVVQTEAPELSEGDILVAIEKFAITANNVGYAVSGNIIGYWKYFPTDDQPWGKVTVWGMADVLESRCEGVQAGERLYGFFPMSTHVKMTPSRVRDDNFIDGAAHRLELPALYNHYSRTKSEPIELQAIETQRKLCESLDGKDGWSPVPGWPQTFAKIGPLGKPIIITIYVDDMVMSGPGHFREWPSIRRLIRTTEPKRIDRALGVNFTFTKIDEYKHEVRMSMEKYAEQTVKAYLDVSMRPALRAKVTHSSLVRAFLRGSCRSVQQP